MRHIGDSDWALRGNKPKPDRAIGADQVDTQAFREASEEDLRQSGKRMRDPRRVEETCGAPRARESLVVAGDEALYWGAGTTP